MKAIKQILGLFVGLITFIFFYLFKRESGKRKEIEKKLEASKQENDAAKANQQALEVKQNVKNKNMRDPRNRVERMREKGYLRD